MNCHAIVCTCRDRDACASAVAAATTTVAAAGAATLAAGAVSLNINHEATVSPLWARQEQQSSCDEAVRQALVVCPRGHHYWSNAVYRHLTNTWVIVWAVLVGYICWIVRCKTKRCNWFINYL